MHCHFQDFPEFSSPPRMANNVGTNKRETRDVIGYKFCTSAQPLLKKLSDQVVYPNSQVFSKRYGNLLSLLDAKVDTRALQTLLQFYDPKLRCFMFQDYKLAPTLEEYSYLLNIKITNHVPFLVFQKCLITKLLPRHFIPGIKAPFQVFLWDF